MAGLQRSQVSFRRQGSSGLVWDDKLVSGELNQVKPKEDQENQQQNQEPKEPSQLASQSGQDIEKVIDDKLGGGLKPVRTSVNAMERSRSNGGARGYRTGRVSPAIEPPSPRLSACGFCSAFSKDPKTTRKKKSGKRRSR